jgi:uncharacterized membrane protein HdeD (DUF308 family)
MESERPVDDTLLNAAPWRLHSWKASFLMGLATLILGLIVAFRPSGSLVVITVLLGILMMFSGVFHIIAALDGPEQHRAWRAIAGVLFIVGGIILVRHLQFSLALIGLIVGFTWVIQGVSALIGGITQRAGQRGWPIFFGIVSVIAGIVVISVPVSSIVILATFLGIWFAVIGVFEMVDAFMSRHAWDQMATGQVNVPGQRAQSEAADTGQAGGQADGEPGGSTAAGRNVQG